MQRDNEQALPYKIHPIMPSDTYLSGGNIAFIESPTEFAEFFEDEWDDAGGEVTARLAGAESSEWDFLAEHDVAEVMTRKLVAIAPDAPAEEAARLMNECGIHRVFVIDARRVIGVVSAIDIARAVAEHQLGTRTYVFNRDRDFENPTASGRTV